MSLNSFRFVVYFAVLFVVMVVLQLLRKKNKAFGTVQLILLLAFSYFFILKADWRFCVCIAAVTFFTYALGVLIVKSNSKIFLTGGVIALLGFLAYFKYTNFFVNSFRQLIGKDTVALKIILPVGISFYIFSALAYLIDVYKGVYKAEKNILHFALYIAFFPKLTAGPIVRGRDFFPQVREYRGVEVRAFETGIQIFFFGLFKKIVLADHLGVFVDDVFFAPTAYNTGTVILAAISYSLQIYYDFSGYSDMAIGVAKIVGFDFKQNFKLPYIAQNVSDFWKRWHISLSSWFQDYLYIPLGGSRKGEFRTYLNLMIVMLLSGLWHGAGWTFIIWGALHGLASCVNKAFGKKLMAFGKYVNIALTFIFVTLAWVVFRADSIETAWKVWTGMLIAHKGISQPYTWSLVAIVCLVIGTLMAVIYSNNQRTVDMHGNVVVNGYYPVMDLTKLWSLVIFFTFCGLTIILGYYGNTAFIYGSF